MSWEKEKLNQRVVDYFKSFFSLYRFIEAFRIVSVRLKNERV